MCMCVGMGFFGVNRGHLCVCVWVWGSLELIGVICVYVCGYGV